MTAAAASTAATAASIGTAASAAASTGIAAVGASALPRAKRLLSPPAAAQRSKDDEWIRRRPAPPVLPPSQDVSVLRRQCAEDRLQGRQAAAALHFRARQDRAEPHHGGLGEEAARARNRDQAGALPRAAALRDPLIADRRSGATRRAATT